MSVKMLKENTLTFSCDLNFLDSIHHQDDYEVDLLLPPLKSKGKW